MKNNEKGFTLPELLIAIVVIGLLITPVMDTLMNYYLDTVRDNSETRLITNARSAMNTIAEDMKYSAGADATNVLTDSYAPSGGWTTDSTKQTIVLKMPAVDANGNFITAGDGTIYDNEYIYYVSSNSLYRRTLKNSTAPNNAAVTSCPPDHVATGCPADVQLATDVTSMAFTLENTDGTTAGSPSTAPLIILTMNFEHSIGSDPVSTVQTNTITFRNKI